jgi:hypothetical protein
LPQLANLLPREPAFEESVRRWDLSEANAPDVDVPLEFQLEEPAPESSDISEHQHQNNGEAHQ